MTDDPQFDPRQFFETLRKSASVKAGAILLGEAQTAYFTTLEQTMTREEAFNMTAHTTECVFSAVARAAGPVAAAVLNAANLWERMGNSTTDKEVPGGA